MQYSGQDWIFRFEVIVGTTSKDNPVMAVVVDDGRACEDHVIVVNNNIQSKEQMAQVISHEFAHAIQRFMRRR